MDSNLNMMYETEINFMKLTLKKNCIQGLEIFFIIIIE